MNGLIAWWARNSVAANLIMVGIFVSGVIGFSNMEREMSPQVRFPGLEIAVSWPGAAPHGADGVAGPLRGRHHPPGRGGAGGAGLGGAVGKGLAGGPGTFDVQATGASADAFAGPSDAEFSGAVETLCGCSAKTALFGTEAPYLAELGLQTLVLGAGDIAVAHQPDEYVTIAAIERATDVYANLIQRFCIEST